MSFARSVMWGLGAVLVVVGVGLLLVETGLASWIPQSILGAGIVVLLGIIVMGMANKSGGSGGSPPRSAEAGEDEDPQIIKVE